MNATSDACPLQLCTAADLQEKTRTSGDARFNIFDAGNPPALDLGCPPVLCSQGAVVWGFSLIEAAQEGSAMLPVLELGSLPPAEVLLRVLRRENRTDSYSFAEMDRLDDLMTELELAEADKRRIDPLVQRKGSFRAHLAQYRELPTVLRAGAATGKVDVRTAAAAAGLPSSAVRTVLNAELGFSARRIILSRLAEICLRDELGDEQAGILAAEIVAAPDPAAELQQLRYPELSRRQQRAAELNQRDSAGLRMEVQLPHNLEGDSVTLVCKVRTPDEFREILQRLDSLHGRIHEYLDLL
ncbi:hypothetical protein [Spirochaeta africana]|uniref:Uncharacterized protein n=1 Tax=Spirochaeta africana (strain ATCC 700263 / DSM 8902 / Z-7692) TaxID=889378 RepID=H9ULV2_SPIAZ|nr:hypothetical protein [Spirochaeta africana]AFG38495.1 hypothetical protein Spiaf_2464 [Spirochaeta africana DSM 8902]